MNIEKRFLIFQKASWGLDFFFFIKLEWTENLLKILSERFDIWRYYKRYIKVCKIPDLVASFYLRNNRRKEWDIHTDGIRIYVVYVQWLNL